MNALPNKLATNVPSNIGRNLPICSFASFLIVLPISFISNHDSSSDLTIFVISSVSPFRIINAVVPESKNVLLNNCICC